MRKLVLIFLEPKSIVCKMQCRKIILQGIEGFELCEEQFIDFNPQIPREHFP
jgi:hypothetical protein